MTSHVDNPVEYLPEWPPAGRDALISDAHGAVARIQHLRVKREELKETLDHLHSLYLGAIQKTENEEQGLRQFLADYISERGGRGVSFPDVGSAYVTVQKEKVEVDDIERASAVAVELGCVLEPKPDLTAAKKRVLERLQSTGELLPGFRHVPERNSVTIRGATE